MKRTFVAPNGKSFIDHDGDIIYWANIFEQFNLPKDFRGWILTKFDSGTEYDDFVENQETYARIDRKSKIFYFGKNGNRLLNKCRKYNF
jgi:hypothetical protein